MVLVFERQTVGINKLKINKIKLKILIHVIRWFDLLNNRWDILLSVKLFQGATPIPPGNWCTRGGAQWVGTLSVESFMLIPEAVVDKMNIKANKGEKVRTQEKRMNSTKWDRCSSPDGGRAALGDNWGLKVLNG